MNNEIQTETQKTKEAAGPVNPRCLASVPSDMEDLVKEFKAQGLL